MSAFTYALAAAAEKARTQADGYDRLAGRAWDAGRVEAAIHLRKVAADTRAEVNAALQAVGLGRHPTRQSLVGGAALDQPPRRPVIRWGGKA